MPKIYRFENKENNNERTKNVTAPQFVFKQSKAMSGRVPKIFFHSIQQMISHHTEFLCASVVVIQCEKRIKAYKMAFAATINSGRFGGFRSVPLYVRAGILDSGVCGLPATPKRKSNYCFNKKFDRFFFCLSLSLSLAFDSHSTCSLHLYLCTCSIAIFMATIKHLHEMMNLLRTFSINSWNSACSIECDFVNFSFIRR